MYLTRREQRKQKMMKTATRIGIIIVAALMAWLLVINIALAAVCI